MNCTAVAAMAISGLCAASMAQTVAPEFNIPYSIVQLGPPPGVPGSLGGICFKPGDPETIYIMGGANGGSGAMYQIGVHRNPGGYIDSWVGTATLVSTAANNDGGLCEIPGSGGTVLFATYPNNSLGQIKPGSTVPDRYDSLSVAGPFGTTGTCQFVPPGLPGAGNLVIGTYAGSAFYTLPLTVEPGPAPHTYTFGAASPTTVVTSGGPEGIVYVPLLSPIFESTPSMLVCMYGQGKVIAYNVGPEGLPLLSSARDFITGLSGAEGGCLDPRTNTFLFSTFGGGAGVIAVPGFTPPQCGPSDIGRTGGAEGHDGLLNNNDFIVFVARFFNNDMRDDVGRAGGLSGSDGMLDNNDFIAFITSFFNGCH
ncbi:MAG: GC-type dockerin domain-anchored protein [Phycisphaerales bacterium]